MQPTPDQGGAPDPASEGSAATEGEPNRAAAVCEHCGSCHVVRVRDDGTVRVIGTNGTCECGEDDYRVLGAARQNLAGAADGDGTGGETTES